MQQTRFVNLSMHHPQDRGVPSYARLTVDRGLRGGKLDEARLSRTDLLKIIAGAVECLQTIESSR